MHLFAHWRKDLPSALVVFLVAVPLCLGIALASGAPPLAGLIAGAVGGILVGALSGSPLGVSGPAAGLAAVVVAAIENLGSYEAFLAAVVLAGIFQVGLGALRAGVIAYYFPNSVIKGMLCGIGIIIILKQVPHAVGYDTDFEGDESFWQFDHENTFSELARLSEVFSPGALIIALACLLLLLVWESERVRRLNWTSLVPGPLLAVAMGIALGQWAEGNTAAGLGAEHFVDLPDLSAGTAALAFPELSAFMRWETWLTALIIALVASIETLLSVEAIDRLDPAKRVTPADRELRAQGIGNMVSGLLGGLPITQVIVRSSANLQSGARTRLSTMLHGAMILLSVLLIPHLLELVPLASLAAILIIIGFKLAKPALFRAMWAKGWTQFVPFIVTVAGVVLMDLLSGVGLGMGVGIFIVLRNNYLTAYRVQPADSGQLHIELSEEVTFFNKASIQRMLAELPPGTRALIDARRTANLDPDVLEIIQEQVARGTERGVLIELALPGNGIHQERTISTQRSSSSP